MKQENQRDLSEIKIRQDYNKEEKIQDNVEVQIHSIYNHNDRSYYSSFRSSFRTERFTRYNTA